MIRHVAVFRFEPGTPPAQVEAIRAALLGLQDVIPELRSLTCGADLRLGEGNADFAVVADFDDRTGYLAYAEHPEHRRVLDQLVRPHLAVRQAAQIDAGGRDPVAGGI